jgi:integrase
MYACGLRISEATTLEIGAIDRANLVLRIVGKGNKERLAPLPQPVLDELSRLWLSHHNRRWLFPNHRGDAPLNPRALERTCRVAAAAAGIRRGVTPHTLALLSNIGPGVLANFGPPPARNLGSPRLDRGAVCGLESQSGIVRAAPSRA